MYAYRDKIKVIILKIPLGWRTKFILFCLLLALVEEAITTLMTNLAPLFGVNIGEAYITASTNYLDVVILHSVIAFIPSYIVWAFLPGKYNFTPFQVAISSFFDIRNIWTAWRDIRFWLAALVGVWPVDISLRTDDLLASLIASCKKESPDCEMVASRTRSSFANSTVNTDRRVYSALLEAHNKSFSADKLLELVITTYYPAFDGI